MRFVEAEILRADTPLEVCRLAAGQHQALQCQVKGISSEDAFALFQQTALEYLESRGQPWMSDAEMWQVLQQLGVQYQAKKADTKEKSPEEQVHHFLLQVFFYSHRKSPSSTSGGPCRSLRAAMPRTRS